MGWLLWYILLLKGKLETFRENQFFLSIFWILRSLAILLLVRFPGNFHPTCMGSLRSYCISPLPNFFNKKMINNFPAFFICIKKTRQKCMLYIILGSSDIIIKMLLGLNLRLHSIT